MAFDSSTIRPAIGDLPEINDLEDRVAYVEENITLPVLASLASKVDSTTIDYIVSLSQSEYNAIVTPDSRTLYVVVG
jgi:hypothetical protein